MNFRKIPTTFLLIALTATFGYAKKQPKYEAVHPLTPEQHALVTKAIGREKVLIKNIQQRTPLVETYIQDTRPDVKLYQVPVSDQYMLSRVDFGKGFFDKSYEPRGTSSKKGGWFKGSLASITSLTKALGLDTKFTYNPLGFTEMMFLDPSGFDEQHYIFGYVRREFLGSVRTWVYDVHPKVAGMGRFYGRVWIEDEDGQYRALQWHVHAAHERGFVEVLLPLRQLAHECAAGHLAAGGGVRGRDAAGRRQQDRRTEGADALLGLLAQAAHAGQRERERQGGRRGGQERRLGRT